MAYGPTTDAQLSHKLQLLPKTQLHATIMKLLHHLQLLGPSTWITHVHEPLNRAASMNRPSRPILQHYLPFHALLHKESQRAQMEQILGTAEKILHLRTPQSVLINLLRQSHRYLCRATATVLQWHRMIARTEHLVVL